MWVVLQVGIPFRVLFTRLLYDFRGLNRDPNLGTTHIGFGGVAGSTGIPLKGSSRDTRLGRKFYSLGALIVRRGFWGLLYFFSS